MVVLSQHSQFEKTLATLLWSALDWLYPPRCCNCGTRGFVLCEACLAEIDMLNQNQCQKCGYPIRRNHLFCENCRQSEQLFDVMRSWAAYTGILKKALHALKYKRNLALGAIFAKPLVEIIKKNNWPIDIVVPVPLSRLRQRQRGYNQAAIISTNIALTLDLPHSPNSIKRIKETETQISLDVNKRFTNLNDAFYANPAKLNKKKVLLIDDVITTGATMQNCTKAIKNAGADQVYCLSVARTLRHHPK